MHCLTFWGGGRTRPEGPTEAVNGRFSKGTLVWETLPPPSTGGDGGQSGFHLVTLIHSLKSFDINDRFLNAKRLLTHLTHLLVFALTRCFFC